MARQMKTIQPNARVVLEYTLKDDKGEVLDSSDAEDGEPITYVHGYGMLVPGLEAALVGLEVGAAKDVTVSPEEGFGERDDELVLEIDRTDFPEPKSVKVGDEVVAESPDGDEVPMRVVEVKDETVIVDANHPLAGVTLRYAVKVKEIAAASEEEIAEAAAGFEEAGYGGCDDPTHDHSHDGHGHDHAHPHEHGGTSGKTGDLVQLTSKKPS
jgi:FKBP-type peptidyl-prolyl cis-trans isomerase SlyD